MTTPPENPMLPQGPMPPEGWYPDPDPSGAGGMRYWDGATWTDRVAPLPSAAPPPPGPAWQPAATPPAPGQYPAAPAVQTASYQAARLGPAGQQLSGWWRRVAGLILDGFIVGIPTLIVTALAVSAVSASGRTIIDRQAFDDVQQRLIDGDTTIAPGDFADILGSGAGPVIATYILATLVLSILNGVVLVARNGQTLGDRIVGVRKVMADRTVPSFGTALARWLLPNAAGFVPTIGTPALLLNYLWPLWDPRRQTVVDKAVKTYVELAAPAGPPAPRGAAPLGR